MPKIKAFEFISPDKWRFLNNAEVEQAAARATEFVERHFNIDNLEHHIEEYLRQWILVQLTAVYHYPENWLWLTNSSKRNANIVIKDENNRSIALVAARFFGESDLDFEQAGHQLQSDLEEIETVRFGIVTDGRRIAFLCRNTDDQIGDYRTIADFPEYSDLKKYLETNQLPKLAVSTTQKFQKLPTPKSQPKSAAVNTNEQQPNKNRRLSFFAPKSKSYTSNRRAIAVVLGTVVLILLGAWYITKSEPIASGQSSEKAITEPESEKSTVKNAASPSVLPDKPVISSVAPSGGRAVSSRPQKSSRQNPMRELEPDGTIKLNREEMSVMQSRPIMMAPSSRNTQSKVATQGSSTSETQSSNRKIIRLPSQSY